MGFFSNTNSDERLGKKVKNIQKEVKDMKSAMTEYIDNSHFDLEGLQDDLSDLKGLFSKSLEEQEAEFDRKLETSQKAITSINKAAIDILDSKVDEISGGRDLEAIKKELENVSKAHNSLESKVKNVQRQDINLSSDVDSANQKIAEIQNEFRTGIADNGQKINRLEQSFDQYTETYCALERRITEETEQLAENISEDVKNKSIHKIDEYIEKTYGDLPKTVIYVNDGKKEKKVNGITHEKFADVLQFIKLDEPVLLVGPAGTGKNVICKQIAEALNLDFYFTNSVTQEYKLTGFIDANGTYHETEFYKAFKNGGLFMLDEIDASIPEVLVILNAAIANRYFSFPNGQIEAHKDFRVIAAANTFGLGASMEYVGRFQLDAASLDRFAIVEIDYSPAIEQALCPDRDLLKVLRSFRKACATNSIKHIVSYRAFSRVSRMSKVMSLAKTLQTCLVKGLPKDDLNMIVHSMTYDNISSYYLDALEGKEPKPEDSRSTVSEYKPRPKKQASKPYSTPRPKPEPYSEPRSTEPGMQEALNEYFKAYGRLRDPQRAQRLRDVLFGNRALESLSITDIKSLAYLIEEASELSNSRFEDMLKSI